MAGDKDCEMLLLRRALSDKSSSPFSLLSTTLLDLTGQITREGDYYSAYGGSADVWKGTWLKDTANRKVVAIKVVRVNNDCENGHEIMNKRLRKEILVWQVLEHQNILPLLGITYDFGRDKPMGMVCPWLDNGNLNSYLGKRGATLSIPGRFRILCDVAAGLLYLHSRDVVHGDLTGSNILLDGEGRALLADFGLSNIVVEACGPSYVTSSIGGSVRWAAPEHFRISEGNRVSTVTSHGDIYSYGSVILQALTGKLPYSHLIKDAEVLLTLHYGVYPPRPQELADEHWALISQCWAKDPHTRPDIKDVYESVQCHYRDQVATADCRAVSDTLNSTDAVTDNGVVVRCASF